MFAETSSKISLEISQISNNMMVILMSNLRYFKEGSYSQMTVIYLQDVSCRTEKISCCNNLNSHVSLRIN